MLHKALRRKSDGWLVGRHACYEGSDDFEKVLIELPDRVVTLDPDEVPELTEISEVPDEVPELTPAQKGAATKAAKKEAAEKEAAEKEAAEKTDSDPDGEAALTDLLDGLD